LLASKIGETYLSAMRSFLQTEINEKKYGTILALRGSLCRATHKKLDFILKEVLVDKDLRFALDLKGLEHIDAKGLSIITRFSALLNKKGGALYAFGMSNDIFNILDFVDTAVAIKMVKSEKEFRNSTMKTCS
jgi:anti-anti-sigma factor